ncbi:MAG: CRISPR-associated endonuclease Cas1 [Phaeodactylibacter sp.]|nr:CRISPR-associated endonuclease Cas1 [Phaeodactylibacter sp.]
MQLYLNTYGVYLHVKDALFEVRMPQDGGGHQKHHFAAQKVTSIIMTTSGALSTDAIRLALQNNIDIIFADSSGFPLGRVWHSKLGSTTKIRKRQLEASIGPEGVRWTIQWLAAKLDNQIELIKNLKKHRARMGDFLDEKAAKIENLRQSMRLQEEAPSVDTIAETLRGLEGTAGRLYFETLSQALPPESRFTGRSFRPAQDPFNAFLNYGYGVLYSRVEKALMIAGLDPYVGFLHRDDYNQKSMVFDFIEPYRIHVETVVFRLFSAKKVNQAHTASLANGVTLVKEGKQLLIEKLNDYLEVQTIRYNGRNQSRGNGLQMDAHRFANELIGK